MARLLKVVVKNMVCDRCKSVLKNEFSNANIPVEKILLGEIQFSEIYENQLEKIRKILTANGFEMIDDKDKILVVNVKKTLVEALNDHRTLDANLSKLISNRINKEYSLISKVFSKHQGITIEKYFIRLKIEKVKELVQMKNKSFSEIAYELNYSSSSHLAKQFKAITGMSMSEYQNVQQWNRKPLDQIV